MPVQLISDSNQNTTSTGIINPLIQNYAHSNKFSSKIKTVNTNDINNENLDDTSTSTTLIIHCHNCGTKNGLPATSTHFQCFKCGTKAKIDKILHKVVLKKKNKDSSAVLAGGDGSAEETSGSLTVNSPTFGNGKENEDLNQNYNGNQNYHVESDKQRLKTMSKPPQRLPKKQARNKDGKSPGKQNSNLFAKQKQQQQYQMMMNQIQAQQVQQNHNQSNQRNQQTPLQNNYQYQQTPNTLNKTTLADTIQKENAKLYNNSQIQSDSPNHANSDTNGNASSPPIKQNLFESKILSSLKHHKYTNPEKYKFELEQNLRKLTMRLKFVTNEAAGAAKSSMQLEREREDAIRQRDSSTRTLENLKREVEEKNEMIVNLRSQSKLSELELTRAYRAKIEDLENELRRRWYPHLVDVPVDDLMTMMRTKKADETINEDNETSEIQNHYQESNQNVNKEESYIISAADNRPTGPNGTTVAGPVPDPEYGSESSDGSPVRVADDSALLESRATSVVHLNDDTRSVR